MAGCMYLRYLVISLSLNGGLCFCGPISDDCSLSRYIQPYTVRCPISRLKVGVKFKKNNTLHI